MDKRARLAEIIKYCEARFSRGSALQWKHGDFSDLSRDIFRHTEVTISPNTLKRIFGKISVEDDYLPQQATTEALQKYGGYVPEVASHSAETIEAREREKNSEAEITAFAADPLPEAKHSDKPKKSLSLTIAFVAILLVAAAFVVRKLQVQDKPAYNIALGDIEGVLPATAFFNLKIPDGADSVFADFGDKTIPVYVKPGQKSVAHIYLFPGVFNVTLKKEADTVATAKTYIRSDKWIGLGFHRQSDLPERYYAFPAQKSGPDSLFHIPNIQLYRAGLDTTGAVFTRLCNFTPVADSSENFVFEATFKNAPREKGIYCNNMQFQIAGIKSLIRFKLVSPGCSNWVLNILSEQVFEGSKTNLSQFAVRLDDWNKLKLVNHHKHVTLEVNGKKLFNGTYQKPLGEIKGIFLEFEGNGFVKDCSLKSGSGKMLYQF